MVKRLAVLTTGRQDYGILRSTILALHRSPAFELYLYVGGMHLDSRFGGTARQIQEDGLEVHRSIHFTSDPPDPGRDAARAVEGVVDALEADRPEAIMLVGDRSETLAAALAATVLSTPIVHLHGGEESEGAIDNAMRHAITKLSHLHLTSHEQHAARVLQMGELREHVHVVGPGGTDNLHRDDLPDRGSLLDSIGLRDPAPHPLITVTIHPTTLSGGDLLAETSAVAEALSTFDAGIVITMPNSDAGGAEIREHWEEWAKGRSNVALVTSLGERRYWGLMSVADAMVSNSSSGLIEAPAVSLPVVNVGDRQKGRLRHPMTLDVAPLSGEVSAAVSRAIEPGFREALRAAPALYPPGPVWPRVLELLRSWSAPSPPRKSFADWVPGGLAR